MYVTTAGQIVQDLVNDSRTSPNPRIDLRVIQVDYNPVRFDFNHFGTTGIPGSPVLRDDLKRTLHNFRLGIGIVFSN